jgi:hypothetical protein
MDEWLRQFQPPVFRVESNGGASRDLRTGPGARVGRRQTSLARRTYKRKTDESDCMHKIWTTRRSSAQRS